MYAPSLMIKVSELYYFKKCSQREIAEALKISVPTVSRILQEAIDSGIVKVQITNILNRVTQMEESLKKKYGLEGAVVVETPLDRDDWHIKKLLGKKASELFFEIASPGSKVGIGAGGSIFEMIESFDGEKSIPGIQLIPLMGGWGLQNLQNETNKLVGSMASILRCTFQLLLAPAIASSEKVKNVFLNEPQISAIVQMWDDLDTAIFSVGPEIEHSIFPSIVERPGSVEEIKEKGAVGDIVGRIIDKNGEEMNIDFNRRMIAIPFEKLIAIKNRVGIGGGSRKIRSVSAAIKKGIVNYLITDSETCKYILENGGKGL
ncbi:MAG: winged helix-turn-helix transcriptional regulator [Kosmotogaceae bacterium]|nr:winged helix-turn-helix transcriptional regulator [Kosmotogaceae bacterium]